MNLTAKTVAGLTLPAGKNDAINFDDALPGFGYRLRRHSATAQVRGTWVAQYRAGGATRRVRLGDAKVLNAEAARGAAKKILAQAALGQDPQEERPTAAARTGSRSAAPSPNISAPNRRSSAPARW